MKIKHLLLAGVLSTAWAYQAHAGGDVSQLGTTLTKFGAIQAGTANGDIPAYTGGIAAMTGLPTNAGPLVGYPDPFPNDKVLFSITSANMAQYSDELTEGAKAVLTRFPDYRIDVYQTRRTFSYPSWVLDNTVKNASSAKEVGDGDGVTGAYGGIPFPIPQDGNQVIWNTYLQYKPAYCHMSFQNKLIDSSGAVTDLGTIETWWPEMYYDQSATSLPGNFFKMYKVLGHTPPANAGKQYLFEYPINFQASDQVTWYYTPGTRRVRLAPEFKYDTPIADYGGAFDFDEIDQYYSRLDKFDWKLIGEKEMIVPYNDYKFINTTIDNILGTHFLKPDGVRWERHRVWIVQGTLKPGARHIYAKWTLYVDEDSWDIAASESYDHGGNIYRIGFAYPSQNYSQGEATNFARTYGMYNMAAGNYVISYINTLGNGFYSCTTTLPNMSTYTPQAMAASGMR